MGIRALRFRGDTMVTVTREQITEIWLKSPEVFMWRRWRFTIIGAAFTVVALGVCIAAYDSHQGERLSVFLFPVSGLLFHNGDPIRWFISLLVHWPLIGFVTDLLLILHCWLLVFRSVLSFLSSWLDRPYRYLCNQRPGV